MFLYEILFREVLCLGLEMPLFYFQCFAVLSSLHIQEDLPRNWQHTPFSCVCFFITMIKGWSSMQSFLHSNTNLGIHRFSSIHLQSAHRERRQFSIPHWELSRICRLVPFPGAQAIICHSEVLEEACAPNPFLRTKLQSILLSVLLLQLLIQQTLYWAHLHWSGQPTGGLSVELHLELLLRLISPGCKTKKDKERGYIFCSFLPIFSLCESQGIFTFLSTFEQLFFFFF